MYTQPFIHNWWTNRLPAVTMAGVRAGEAVSIGWQVTLCECRACRLP